MSKIRNILAILMVSFFAVSTAFAGETPFAATDHARMRILTGIDSIGEKTEHFEAALHMSMDEGWHSYWRVPGDAGAPPVFDWSASTNVKSVEVSWQAPKRYDEFGFQTFGYSNDVYYPLVVNLVEPNKATDLKVHIKTMVCSDICIPQTFDLAVSIPVGDGATVTHQRIIDNEKRRVPKAGNSPNLQIETVVAGPKALVVSAYSKNGFDKVDIFAYAPEITLSAIPQMMVDEDTGQRALISISAPEDVEDLNALIAGKTLNVTMVSGRDAIERSVTLP